MSSFLHSIRWRVQAWHGLILLTVILAFCFTVYRVILDNQLRRVDHNLSRLERSLIRGLLASAPTEPGAASSDKGPPNPLRLLEYLRRSHPELPEALTTAFRGTEPGYAYFSLCDGDGRVLLASPNAPAPADLALLPVPATDFNDEWRTRDGHRESLHGSPNGLRSIVGVDLTPEREEIRRYLWSLTAAGLGVWLLGLVGGWWLAGRAIRPIQNISRTATRIADGNFAERIDTAGTDSELDQLSQVLNASFDRLRGAMRQQKQFIADASHELRTPVTVLLAETQRALKRERSGEEYRASIHTCHQTATRLRGLTESLLLLARQEAAGTNRPHESCDLAALLRDTVVQLQPLAATRELQFQLDLQPASCRGDLGALSILATNLVANAIQHHDHTGGIVRLHTRTEAGRACLIVSDDGPGIPAEALPHIFERFFRVDQVRTRGSGHAGLGLAIAQTIAVNHGGTLVATNNPGRGARFTFSLPAA